MAEEPLSLLPPKAAATTDPGAGQTGPIYTSRFAAKHDEVLRKANETPSTAAAARTRSLADFLVPGMLDLSIAKALLVLSDVCYRLQESQVLAQRLLNRMLFLRGEVENKTLGTRIQSDVILRYGEQVGKAIQFMRQHQSKTLLARIAANRRFLDGLCELHAHVDRFFTKVGLASRAEMREWSDEWASDLALQQQLFASFVSSRFVMVAELTERGAEEALTEIHAELAKPQRTESHVALMASVVEHFQHQYAMVLRLPVPPWFLARDEVQYKQEPFAIGSYGALYRGTLVRTSARVVVKSMYSDSKQTQSALYNECTLWSELDHPNVLKMTGACYVGSPMFFVCEDAGDRRSFPEFLSESPRNRLKLWPLLLEAAEGLAYLHGRRVVHNNLKGSNIVVGVDGRAKLCDFGFSYNMANAKDTDPKRHSTASRWKAPELLLAATGADAFPTFASDMYAFGMCIIEAVTGDRPWGPNRTDPDVVRMATTQRYARPPGFTDKQWQLVESLCAFEREKRPSVQQLIEALKDVIQAAPDGRSANATKACARCSSANPAANKFCNECGNRF